MRDERIGTCDHERTAPSRRVRRLFLFLLATAGLTLTLVACTPTPEEAPASGDSAVAQPAPDEDDVERTGSGDEPTIRVKNGSMVFEIINSSRRWAHASEGAWGFNRGRRANLVYTVDIGTTNPDCPRRATGSRIVVHSGSANVTLTIDANSKRTRLTPRESLRPEDSDRVLRHVGGDITRIEIDETSCDFDQHPLEDVIIHDF
jgi:hypothetical protein